ncbi:LMBR1-like membrane protein [Protomyces lactucae-debilis]|uniref:LMBR1-like membrane protein n=1 Tax=Protomyces lactucae-debilis TaxID=2754530 RepID=A0A1Y2FDT2_PROLT|nr:LMBR1-like membrane protein [Protomyces lactucae-debilis]ORY82080.1 LMBR1-like membrane protein [Protomyces lactucae-debilis]
MILLLVCGTLLVALAVLLFLHRVVSLSSVPLYTSVLGFLAFFLPSSIVVILPLDLAHGARHFDETEDAATLEQRILLKLWRSEYWISFALTLTLLPLMQSFVESGFILDLSKRLRSSVRDNLRFQALYLGLGSVGLIYIVATTQSRLFNSPQAFKAFLIALANTWGLFLALTFMGHGLIGVPKRLWQTASVAEQIADCEAKATSVMDQLTRAKEDEAALAKEVVSFDAALSSEYHQAWVAEIISLMPEAILQAQSHQPDNGLRSFWSRAGTSRTAQDRSDVSDDRLAALTRRVRSVAERRDRYTSAWAHLLKSYESLTRPDTRGTNSRVLREYIRPLAQRCIALCLAMLSFAIIWAELFVNQEKPFLRFLVLPISRSKSWTMEVFSGLLLTYMCICTYSTLLRIRLFNRHALLDRQHTSQSSLFFYGSYCCRVTIPLSYNFISLLPADLRNVSVFSQFLGKAIDLQPLGKAFNDWLPLYILVPVALTLVDVKRLGLAWLQDEDDESAQDAANMQLTEGRNLLKHHLAESHGLVGNRWASDADARSVVTPFRDDAAEEQSTVQKTWTRFTDNVSDSLQSLGDLIKNTRH